MSFKISKTDSKNLQRAINNFNSKIRRLEKVDREIVIPEKTNITAIKERVFNKWDLNREIEKLERFTKRGAEKLIKNKSGVVMSAWEYENIQKEQKRLNSKLLRDIKRYGSIIPKEYGKSQKVSYAQMGDEKLSNLKARQKAISTKKISKLSNSEIRNLLSLMSKTNAYYRKDKEIFYNNFLDGTLLNTAYYVGYDEGKINYIKEKLNELSPTEFVKAFENEQGLKDLQLRYKLVHEDINPDILSEELTPLIDKLYENIDEIVKSYQ